MNTKLKEACTNAILFLGSAICGLAVGLLLPGLCFAADPQVPLATTDKVLLMITSGAISALLTIVIFRLISIGKKGEKTAEDLSELKQVLPIDYVRSRAFKAWEEKIDKKIDKLFNLVLEKLEVKGGSGK